MEVVQLQSKDGMVIPLSRRALKRSLLLSLIAEDELNCGVIKLQTVTSSALAKVVEYLEYFECSIVGPASGQFIILNKKTEMDDDDDDSVIEVQQMTEVEDHNIGLLRAYNKRFLESMSIPHLIEVTKAADYLVINLLFRLCFYHILHQMEGLSTEEKMTKVVQLLRPDPPARIVHEAKGCFGWLKSVLI